MPTAADLARHDGFAIIPARAAKPREKAQVEGGGQSVERWMLAQLRHHPCFSLAEVTTALAPLLLTLHARPCTKLPGSRQPLFETLDRPALRPLPVHPYAYAAWQHARGNIASHVDVAGHSDSVPDALVKQQLVVRLRAQVVALFSKGKRVASHRRSLLKGRPRAGAAHMPTGHQRYAAWTPQRLLPWAAHSGPATAQVVETMLASRPHPPQGFRSC